VGVIIGEGVTIRAGFRIETVTSYAGESYCPKLSIEDDVCINQNFHCSCASSITIGKGTSITANCGIFDIIHPYTDITVNPRKAPIKTEPVNIGENSLIGMNSVIMPGAQLGKHTIVGANSTVVKGIYPDYVVLAGSPAKIIKIYNKYENRWEPY
jgi:acetyltransferase-like isoleucine patch superfamily enzyme